MNQSKLVIKIPSVGGSHSTATHAHAVMIVLATDIRVDPAFTHRRLTEPLSKRQ